MPLSKRINNLHINNPMMRNHHSGVEWGPGPPSSMNHLPDSPPSSEQNLDWKSPTPYSTEYSPDLNENQNPHYFNINKLLFDMYVQRLQRGCHQI
nr:unnamed protein product [Callosobruchus analis]